jgi:eukaryotic-like serine/threonine-protein kinase
MEVALGIGTVLSGKYRVEGVLGRGGMGIVLKVKHLHLGEDLAVKVLLPEGAIRPDVTARFLREAQSVVRLRGEHVARVSDVGVLPEGLPFIVMEYLHGVDLARELKQKTTLPAGKAVDYVLQACEALAEAHAHGIVHRDVKPANLFLTTRPDGTALIKVLDFGISKAPTAANSVVTQTEVVMGTPGYMSPEQMKAAKDVDPRTDIWALGIVLYECLTGCRPFDGESYTAIVLRAGTEPPAPMNPAIPGMLQATVPRCLEKDRRARFPTIAVLAAALAPFARNQREAATIVERTSLMLQGSGGADERAAHVDQPQATTTLSGSAGSGARPRHRSAITRGLWAFGLLATLFTVSLVSARLLASKAQPSHAPDEQGTGYVDYAKLHVPTVIWDAGAADSAIANARDAARELSVISVIAPESDARLQVVMLADAGDAGDAGVVDAPPDAPPVPKHRPGGQPQHPRDPVREQNGVIVVRVKQTWAQVWIDGQDAGTTPVRDSVPAGIHKVLLTTDGHREYVTVTVTAASESVIERNW